MVEQRNEYLGKGQTQRMISQDTVPSPLSVELFDSPHCMEISAEIHEFENRVFGPDFACTYDCFRLWVESPSLICAAMVGELVAGRLNILSVASMLVTDTASRDRMLGGEIHDYQLVPWQAGQSSGCPVLYFSSVISDNPAHLAALYESLAADFDGYLRGHQLAIESAFCVASGPAGFRHLTRSGFVAMEGRRYMGKYDFLMLDATMAKTAFWDQLLGGPPRCGISEVGLMSSDKRNELIVPVAGDSARDVEKRLARSKSQRYLGGKHW